VERFVAQGIVLGTVDYGEADRVVTLFTRDRGKVSAFAAGARKSKRRFAGALEPLTLLTVDLVERNGTTFRLDQARIDRPFLPIRGDLARIARALYAVELSRELVREQEPNEALFSLLLGYLELLEAGAAGPTSLLAFELTALSLAGFRPRFEDCAVCGGPLPSGAGPDAAEVRFDPEHGGAVCAACVGRSPAGRRVAPEVIAGLGRIQAGARVPLPKEIRARARELLNLFIAHQLGRTLNGVAFMEQVGVD
jgi:DNA repair protein RecO (recombination protein O)